MIYKNDVNEKWIHIYPWQKLEHRKLDILHFPIPRGLIQIGIFFSIKTSLRNELNLYLANKKQDEAHKYIIWDCKTEKTNCETSPKPCFKIFCKWMYQGIQKNNNQSLNLPIILLKRTQQITLNPQ